MWTSASASEVRIAGHWHAPGQAARQPATLVVQPHEQGAAFTVLSDADTVLLQSAEAPVLGSRVGNIERRADFAGGSVFVTADNDAMDAAFRDAAAGKGAPKRSRRRAGKHAGRGSGGPSASPSSWLHRLESSLPLILLGVLVTIGAGLAFFFVGIPYASERIAHALPQRVGTTVSTSTLAFLDKWLLEDSALDPERQRQIEAHVRERLLPLDARNDGIDYRILFRDWTMNDVAIPNALALPSGDIVLTDAFVELSATQDEMDSVILHEIGHIVERHSLQRLVQATFVGSTVMLVTGDGSGLADMGVGLGSLLVSSHYSRGHETAADRYAFDRMLQAGIDPIAFGDIMARMQASVQARKPGHPSESEPKAADDDERGEARGEGRRVLDYLASHPVSERRIEQARRYSECFKLGMTSCPEQ